MFFFKKKKPESTFDKPVDLTPPEHIVPDAPVSAPAPAPAAGSDTEEVLLRKRRRAPNPNKTRLMGFDASDGRVVGLFDEEQKSSGSGRAKFPVAVVMVTKGPGLGESFVVKSGMSQIGRAEGQAVQLDFGDMAISRENHAAIVYDPKEHTLLLGHGGKSNIVRLNGKPVVTTSDLTSGDEIEIGETQLRIVALCSKEFNWEIAESAEGSDEDDVEIA